MSWRVARSLLVLRDQANAAWPDRNRRSDGTVGDAAHRSRTSDHNPWVDGAVVTALDLTHDPASGADMHALAARLVASRDPRIKYVIWNRRIVSRTVSPWQWRAYGGSNPHTTHLHVSVEPVRSRYDDVSPWSLPGTKTLRPSTNEEDEDMAISTNDLNKIAAHVWGRTDQYVTNDAGEPRAQSWILRDIRRQVVASRAKLAGAAAGGATAGAIASELIRQLG